MNEIENELALLIKNNRKIKRSIIQLLITFICLFVGLMLVIYANYNYISNLENQIKVKDSLIQELTQKDSIYKQVFTLNTNLNGTKYSYSIRRKGSRVIKYNELADSLDGISGKYEVLKYHLDDVKFEKKLSDMNRQSLEEHYTDLNNSYNFLMKEYKKSVIENNKFRMDKAKSDIRTYNNETLLKDSLRIFHTWNELAKCKYGISFKATVNNNLRSYNVTSEKLDSALLLYYIYKDKLVYDKKNKSWSVKK